MLYGLFIFISNDPDPPLESKLVIATPEAETKLILNNKLKIKILLFIIKLNKSNIKN